MGPREGDAGRGHKTEEEKRTLVDETCKAQQARTRDGMEHQGHNRAEMQGSMLGEEGEKKIIVQISPLQLY